MAVILSAGATLAADAEPVPAIAFGGDWNDPGLADLRSVFLPGESYSYCATLDEPLGALVITERVVEEDGPVVTSERIDVEPDWPDYCGWDRLAPSGPGIYEQRLYRGAQLIAAGRFAVVDAMPSPLLRPPAVTPDPQPARTPGGDGTTLRIMVDGRPVEIALYTESAPVHAAALADLARSGYLATTSFDMGLAGAFVRGGAPPADGVAPVWTLPFEATPGTIARGTVIIDGSVDPEGARFAVVLSDLGGNLAAAAPAASTIVGQVTSGIEVLDAIAAGPGSRLGVLDDPVPVDAVELLQLDPPTPPETVTSTPLPDADDLMALLPDEVDGLVVTKGSGSGESFGIPGAETVAIGVVETGDSMLVWKLVDGSMFDGAMVAGGAQPVTVSGIEVYPIDGQPGGWVFVREGHVWVVTGSEDWVVSVVEAVA